MLRFIAAHWRALSASKKAAVVAIGLAFLVCAAAAINYMRNSNGVSVVDPDSPVASYFAVFLLIALDGVIPIFPGETTLNAAATLAAQGKLDLGPIIVMGALGAIVGDSTLFWVARKSSSRIERQLDRAKANDKVREAFELLDKSAPVLIIGGRYLPGMRFVVNATMGLSTIAYRRFLVWSVISGTLWSIYTCVMAHQIGLALGDYPLASFIVSSLVTTAVLAVVFFTVRHQRRRAAAQAGPSNASPPAEDG